jgi:hypothetical protein
LGYILSYTMNVRKLIIQYDPGLGTTPNDEDMKEIREQFEKEDIIFLDTDYNVLVVEYDELAFTRNRVSTEQNKES